MDCFITSVLFSWNYRPRSIFNCSCNDSCVSLTIGWTLSTSLYYMMISIDSHFSALVIDCFIVSDLFNVYRSTPKSSSLFLCIFCYTLDTPSWPLLLCIEFDINGQFLAYFEVGCIIKVLCLVKIIPKPINCFRGDWIIESSWVCLSVGWTPSYFFVDGLYHYINLVHLLK